MAQTLMSRKPLKSGRKAPAPVVATAPAKPATAAVPAAGRNLPLKPEFAEFARTLRAAMADKGMNASDLARAIWGTVDDPRGYPVAKNRDRIGAYLAGTGYPSRETLPKLCEALGLDIATLPLPTRSSASREFAGTPDVTFTLMTEHPGLCSVYIRMMLPVAAGLQIIDIVNKAKQELSGE